MATYKSQVEDIVAATVTDTAMLDTALTAEARTIIDLLPDEKLEKYAIDVTITEAGTSVANKKVLKNQYGEERVHTGNIRCRKVDAGLQNAVVTSGSLHYALATDPVFMYDNGKLIIYSAGTGTAGVAQALAYPTVGNADESISGGFPGELEKGVVLGASLRTIENLMAAEAVVLDALTLGATTANINNVAWATAYPNQYSDIVTALTAINTQVDNAVTETAKIAGEIAKGVIAITTSNTETDLAKAEAAKMAAEITLAKAEIAKAITEVGLSNTELDKMADEIALANADLDNAATNLGTNVNTALTAITTASGRINTAVGLANTEYDKISAIVDLANIEFDLVNTDIDTASASAVDGSDLDKANIQTEIGSKRVENGNAYLLEARERISTGDAYLKEAQTNLAEVQAYVGEVNSRIQQISEYTRIANGYLGVAQGYAQSGDGYMKTASGYIQTGQSYLQIIQGIAQTLQGYISTASIYLQEAQKDVDMAMGYSVGAKTYLEVGNGYVNEVQVRLSILQTEIAEYTARTQKEQNELAVNISRSKSIIESWKLTYETVKQEYKDLLGMHL